MHPALPRVAHPASSAPRAFYLMPPRPLFLSRQAKRPPPVYRSAMSRPHKPNNRAAPGALVRARAWARALLSGGADTEGVLANYADSPLPVDQSIKPVEGELPMKREQ